MVPVTTIVLLPAALILEDNILKRLDVYLIGAQQAQELEGTQYLIGVVVFYVQRNVFVIVEEPLLDVLQHLAHLLRLTDKQVIGFYFLFLCHCLRSL